ncbi:MAG: hypothetical protein LBS89_08375 [Zoogloeaceae bacterium]|jgi:hypothetical protein|nr:hypothetical protein [Zoogloeaceae bacterium]
MDFDLFVKIAGGLFMAVILVGWLVVPYAREKSDAENDIDDFPRRKSHHDDSGDMDTED